MIVVCPVRFTDKVPEMRAFLELLGLSPRIESTHGTWVDLSAGEGMVALHEAAASSTGGLPGETRLSFEVDDADAVAEVLRGAGHTDATVVDESYGRVVMVTDPDGAEIQLNERQDDLYGYVEHDQLGTARERLGVVPVRFTDDSEGHHRFLTALGMVGEPAPGGYWSYSSGGGGFVGIHHVYAGGRASVQLTVATEADLGELQQRLEGAGSPVTRFDEDFGSFLEAIDPDGQSVQIHGWPE